MLLWPPPGSKFSVPPICSYVPHCASCEDVAVAPARINISKYGMALRTLLSSKSSKNDSKYQHYWNSWFLLFIIQLHLCSKTQVILSILGVPGFVCVRLSFIFFIFLMEKHIFCNCCYFACAIFSPQFQFWRKTTTKYQHFQVPKFGGSHTRSVGSMQNAKKNERDFNQNWKQFFVVICAHMHVRSKTLVIIRIFGMLDFVSDWLFFEIVILP